MPTLFSKCIECKKSQPDYEKMELLKEAGLPTELAIHIIRLTYSYVKCPEARCAHVLCNKHASQYGSTICTQCNNRLWRLSYEHMFNRNN